MIPNDIEGILRSKLRDVPMETVSHDWTAIERSLGLAPKRRVPLGRILATAAACLAALVAGGLFLWQGPVETLPVEYPAVVSSEPPRAVESPFVKHSPTESSAGEVIARLKQGTGTLNTGRSVAGVDERPEITLPARDVPGDDRTAEVLPEERRSSPQQQTASDRPAPRRVTVPAGASGRPFENPRRRSPRGSNWMLALFADGASGAQSGRAAADRKFDNILLANVSPNSYLFASAEEMASSVQRASTHSVQEVVLLNSSPVLRQADMVWNHQTPLAFGLSARKNLTDRWGVELGLTYTYLSSKASVSTGNSRYDRKQQLHYLGVPLSVSYTPLRRGNFELYGRAGGAIDLNIAGRRSETTLLNGTGNFESTPVVTRFTEKTPQWSVMARVGVMYKFSPALGVYLEPGVAHYFDNGGAYESYWTDHPTQFNLQVGVRTMF
jgi:opacity protein-like surface antigen